VVIGAGAFGGWTALTLLRAGMRVTLVDAWGAGNSRASSGGETRVIRTVYNGNALYTQMAARAFTLWREAEQQWKRQVLFHTGAIWMCETDDSYVRRSIEPIKAVGTHLVPAKLHAEVEFPITVVCGFNSPPGGRRRGVQVAFGPGGETILRLRQGLEQPGFDATRAIDEQMDEHERIRLLYVACTRARDHLVVSLHRVDDHRMTGAQLLAGCVTGPEELDELAGVQEVAPALADTARPQPTSPPGAQPQPTVTDLAAWRAQREDLIAAARLPGSLSATGLAASPDRGRHRTRARGARGIRRHRRFPTIESARQPCPYGTSCSRDSESQFSCAHVPPTFCLRRTRSSQPSASRSRRSKSMPRSPTRAATWSLT